MKNIDKVKDKDKRAEIIVTRLAPYNGYYQIIDWLAKNNICGDKLFALYDNLNKDTYNLYIYIKQQMAIQTIENKKIDEIEGFIVEKVAKNTQGMNVSEAASGFF